MKLLDGEMTAAQLREIHNTYGLPVYNMAVRVQAARSVLRRMEKDPEVRETQRLAARHQLRSVIGEGETHGLLRVTNGEVWLVPPKLTAPSAAPAETRAAPARAPAEASVESKTLLTLIEAAAEALSARARRARRW